MAAVEDAWAALKPKPETLTTKWVCKSQAVRLLSTLRDGTSKCPTQAFGLLTKAAMQQCGRM